LSAGHVHGGPDCRELLGGLSEYLDGELDLAACEKVREHMGDCPRCQEFLESLRRTVAHVRAVSPAAIPPELKRAIIDSWERLRQRAGE